MHLPTKLVLTLTVVLSTSLCWAKKGGSGGDYAVPLDEANRRFLECCKQTVDETCWEACAYNMKVKAAKDAFLNDGPCGYGSIEPVLKCANGKNKGSDNRQCCKSKGVYKEDGSLCERYCQKDPYTGTLSKEHMKCGVKLFKILDCHHKGLKP